MSTDKSVIGIDSIPESLSPTVEEIDQSPAYKPSAYKEPSDVRLAGTEVRQERWRAGVAKEE